MRLLREEVGDRVGRWSAEVAVTNSGYVDGARAIARWAPASVRPAVAAFARAVVTRAAPKSAVRAKALLFATGKLGTFAISVGLELVPEIQGQIRECNVWVAVASSVSMVRYSLEVPPIGSGRSSRGELPSSSE